MKTIYTKKERMEQTAKDILARKYYRFYDPLVDAEELAGIVKLIDRTRRLGRREARQFEIENNELLQEIAAENEETIAQYRNNLEKELAAKGLRIENRGLYPHLQDYNGNKYTIYYDDE